MGIYPSFALPVTALAKEMWKQLGMEITDFSRWLHFMDYLLLHDE